MDLYKNNQSQFACRYLTIIRHLGPTGLSPNQSWDPSNPPQRVQPLGPRVIWLFGLGFRVLPPKSEPKAQDILIHNRFALTVSISFGGWESERYSGGKERKMSGTGKKIVDVAFKASRTIDWDGMAKLIVTEEARKEFATLRRAFDEVNSTLQTKFSQVSSLSLSMSRHLCVLIRAGSLCSLELGFFVLTFFILFD